MKKILGWGIIMPLLLSILSNNVGSSEAISSEFTNPINISNNTGDSFVPQEIISGNNVYVLWNDNSTGKFSIFLAKSDNGGISFGKPVNISKDVGSSASPQFVVTENKVFVVWQSKTIGKSQISFAKSTDGGETFSNPVNISNNSGDSSFPKISVSGRNIFVIWASTITSKDYDVLFTKSTDDGDTFSTPANVSNTLGDTGLPQMFVSGNNIYVTWENNGHGNFDVFVAKSTDKGDTFGVAVNVSNDPKPSGAPQIFASGSHVYVVWMDNSSGNYDIFFAKSTDNASTFSVPVNVSNNKGDSGYPQIAVSGNEVDVVWTDAISNNNYEILFAKSTDGGVTFGAPINISNTVGQSGWPQIAISGNVYVNWQDNETGKFDILISKSTNGGTTFSKPINISNTSTDSSFQQMFVSNNGIYVVWQDGSLNHNEVLFSKSTAFVPEFGTLSSLVLLLAIISIIIISAKTIPKLQMCHNPSK